MTISQQLAVLINNLEGNDRNSLEQLAAECYRLGQQDATRLNVKIAKSLGRPDIADAMIRQLNRSD